MNRVFKRRIKIKKQFGLWTISFPIKNKKPLKLICRSKKELKRISRFGLNKNDIVWKWLHWLEDAETIYDIGSGSGFEGLLAGHLHDCKVCFVEPYTPSIETILKSVHLQNGNNTATWEIIHAGCSNNESYSRLSMHKPPEAGETLNSFGNAELNYKDGGKTNRSHVVSQQWVKGISIDSLVFKYNLGVPDHVKIDVDGHETFVIDGAKELLNSRKVKSWVIELTLDDTIKNITQLMESFGYTFKDEYNHYPDFKVKTVDRLFVRNDYLTKWDNFNDLFEL